MAYTVISAQSDEHREALRSIWKTNSIDPDTIASAGERFDWLYRDAGPADAQTWLAIETESQAVVGCGSVFRSDRYFRGRRVEAGIPAVFFVAKEHRVAAAALAIQRAVLAGGCRSGFEVFVGKPNPKARLVCDRVGYQPVSDLHDWVKFIWNDDSLSIMPNRVDYVDGIVGAADLQFDGLWDRAKDRYPMAAEKTAAFLNWRYSGFKENYRFYCLQRQDDRQLLGYVVFYAMKDGIVITELLCEEPSGPILQNLLLGFCSRMKSEGFWWVSLWFMGTPSFEDELERIGFSRGKHQRMLVVYVNPQADPAFRQQMLDRNNWFLFAGEMDVILSDEVWRADQAGNVVASDAIASR